VGESRCQQTFIHKLINRDKGICIWMSLNETGCSRGFRGYWSNKNETLFLQLSKYHPYKQNCEWKSNSGAWYSIGRINDNPTKFFSPFGNDDTTSFQFPKGTVGPFANGTKAKRGHYWICGHTAYK